MPRRLEGFWTIARKELRQLTRDTLRLKLLVVFQCLEIMMIGWLDVNAHDLRTIVVDQDHTEESRALVERIAATSTFAISYVTTSTEQARGHVRAGRASLAIIIPPDYGRERAAHHDAQILALVDGSDATSSAQATAAIEGLAGRMNVEALAERVDATPHVSSHAVLLFNPQGSTSSFMLPGLLALLLADTYMIYALQSLTSEREDGNLERLLMTPMSYTALILGKLAPWFGLGVLNGLLYIVVSRFAFGVPIRGSVLLLILGLLGYTLTIVSLGLFIAAGADSSDDARNTAHYVGFPIFFISGYVFPLSSLPKVLLPLSYAMPQTHFIELMRGICMRGANATELAPHLLYLMLAPFLLIIGSVWRFARSVVR